MKHPIRLFLCLLLLGACATSSASLPLQLTPDAPDQIVLSIDDFLPGGALPDVHAFNGFGCTGENRAPRLRWHGAPDGARSYALVVHDPDAPTGVGFFHWVVTDIPAGVNGIDGELPTGARAHHTDYGVPAYGGPCPPEGHGPHHYVFSIYALDTPSLDLPEGATGALVRFVLAQHTLAFGTLVGTYER